MKSKMFFFIGLKIKVSFMRILLNILGGALIVAPVILTVVIIGIVADWFLPWFQYFSPLVPRYASVLVSIFILWVLGRYRKKINGWIDKPLSAIWGVGFIYKFLNNLAESLEDFLNKIKSMEGNIIFVPRSYTSYPELCYLMSKDIMWIWDEKLKSKRAYLSVNFASIPGARGNNPIPVPREIVESYLENQKVKLTIDDAIRYYASLGSKIPDGLLEK